MDLAGKKVTVVGLADSGTAAARFLIQKGALVLANDAKSPAELDRRLDELVSMGASLVLGGHPWSALEDADLIVVSPGVPKHLPALIKAEAAGKPVLSELELASRFIKAPMIAVTGTNGKSTTVTLTGRILEESLGPDKVFMGGNLGTPLTEMAARADSVEAAVVEVSSFQLEFASEFSPNVAVLLNLTADHLDRYGDQSEYFETKMRIFANQEKDDAAVINADDEEVVKLTEKIAARKLTFGFGQKPVSGMRAAGDDLEWYKEGELLRKIPVSEVPLHGRHNLYNVMAALLAADALGADPASARRALASFVGLAHRMSMVDEIEGVKYFNDSKATNSGAVEACVSGLEGPVILLMGGQSKGCSFKGLGERLASRTRLVFAFGEASSQIASEMGGDLEVRTVKDLAHALEGAKREAGAGDSVVLAPGCASFDQFKNYKDRGDRFVDLVKGLRNVD